MDTETYETRKAQLCASIFALVEQFTQETGRHVRSIHLHPIEVTGFGEAPTCVYGRLDNIECNEMEAVQLELEPN